MAKLVHSEDPRHFRDMRSFFGSALETFANECTPYFGQKQIVKLADFWIDYKWLTPILCLDSF